MADLVVKSKVAEVIRSSGMNMAGDPTAALDALVADVLSKAVQRAKDNGRKTVRPAAL